MRRMLTGLSSAAILLLALPALAVPPPNTALTHGYDEDNTTLVFGVSEYDEENPTEGCAGVEGEYDYTLDDEGKVDSYESTDTTEAPTGEETTDTTVTDGTADDAEGIECDLNAVDVTGPNGQVNHGTVVSSFVHALKDLDIQGRGCLVRYIAQSDYGKGDQQIKTSDVDDSSTETTVASEDSVAGGTVTLEAALTACADKGHKPDKTDDDDSKGKPEGVGNGKPEDKGKPEGVGKPENPGSNGKKNK